MILDPAINYILVCKTEDIVDRRGSCQTRMVKQCPWSGVFLLLTLTVKFKMEKDMVEILNSSLREDGKR